MSIGVIFDVKKYAIHDGPGIRTAFFLKGCPLSCWWCHNPESLSMTPALLKREERCIHCGLCENQTKYEKCPTLALEMAGQKVTPREVLEIAKQDELFYDSSGGGVTFTGGEPLLQPEFLFECLELCKKHSIHTAVDTSGFAPQETVKKIASVADLFLFDFKHPDPIKHEYYTGVSNKQILENLLLLDRLIDDNQCRAEVHIRIPLIPTVNMDEGALAASAEFIAKLRNIHKVDLLPYHSAGRAKYPKWNMVYKMDTIQPPAKEEVERARQIFAERNISNLHIGG
ncbi:MAG: glycyl-radical enzyme activating protein [Synergistaceae bacterium]|nr:glycyl-radical enzyme activating protein [Synergistaceae bacterium]